MNVSEPLMKCRENEPSVKTTDRCGGGISTAATLFTGRTAGVMKGA